MRGCVEKAPNGRVPPRQRGLRFPRAAFRQGQRPRGAVCCLLRRPRRCRPTLRAPGVSIPRSALRQASCAMRRLRDRNATRRPAWFDAGDGMAPAVIPTQEGYSPVRAPRATSRAILTPRVWIGGSRSVVTGRLCERRGPDEAGPSRARGLRFPRAAFRQAQRPRGAVCCLLRRPRRCRPTLRAPGVSIPRSALRQASCAMRRLRDRNATRRPAWFDAGDGMAPAVIPTQGNPEIPVGRGRSGAPRWAPAPRSVFVSFVWFVVSPPSPENRTPIEPFSQKPLTRKRFFATARYGTGHPHLEGVPHGLMHSISRVHLALRGLRPGRSTPFALAVIES